jgi:hypothetical protein
MKTKLAVFAILIASSMVLTLAVPALAAPGLNPNKLYGAPNYVLNLIGKKADWSGGGAYDNPDRHTMFVPETTTGIGGTGSLADGTPIQVNLTMWMTQGAEFAVLDGNGFEGNNVSLQLGPGKYAVFVVALGKPGGNSDIRGWVYNETDGTYLFMTGMVKVPGHSKKPVWVDATGLLFVSAAEDPYGVVTGDDQWIFDYLANLKTAMPLGDYVYLWDLDNTSCKHLQIRFYQIG